MRLYVPAVAWRVLEREGKVTTTIRDDTVLGGNIAYVILTVEVVELAEPGLAEQSGGPR